jgi:hypothetical protein
VDNVAQLLLASEMCPRYIDTSLTWDDLVLDSETLQAVEHVLASGRHQIEPRLAGESRSNGNWESSAYSTDRKAQARR